MCCVVHAIAQIRIPLLALLVLLPTSLRAEIVFTIESPDGEPSTNTGSFSSLGLDDLGVPHMSYLELISGNLRYATKSGDAWTIEVADGSPNSVGWSSSLALDANRKATYDTRGSREGPGSSRS